MNSWTNNFIVEKLLNNIIAILMLVIELSNEIDDFYFDEICKIIKFSSYLFKVIIMNYF